MNSFAHNPETCLLVSCPRSGSALLMRIFGESPMCAVTSRLLLTSKGTTGKGFLDDFSGVQQTRDRGRRILVCKESVGETRDGDCQYQIFPDLVAMVRPVFLMRDPIRVFDSWKKMGWNEPRSLIDCFDKLFRMLEQTDLSAISCLLYEDLVHRPDREVAKVCSRLGIPYSASMLQFSQPLDAFFLFKNPTEENNYRHGRPPGLLSTVMHNSTILEDVPCHRLVSNEEKEMIESEVGGRYLFLWGDRARHLHDILLEMPWIGFDLDDTLHEFRRASSAAVHEVLSAMHVQYSIPLEVLESKYSQVLRSTTGQAFVDGKTSKEYRSQRLISVAHYFSLPLEHDTTFLAQLLQLYESTLQQALELKSGALGLLQTIKKLGKRIVIITEGPQDAQEWTIEELGIAPYVDFLATTNHFGVSKTNGLFSKVLAELEIAPGRLAYVGDNISRDMTPALAEGIFSIYFAEDLNCDLELYPPRVNTLSKLNHLLN